MWPQRYEREWRVDLIADDAVGESYALGVNCKWGDVVFYELSPRYPLPDRKLIRPLDLAHGNAMIYVV